MANCHQCNAYYFNSVRVQINSGTERKRENIHFSHYAFFLSLKYTSCTQNCGKCDLTIKACEKVNERMIKKAKN